MSGEQFYVTHCGTADSVLGAPGYSVRAATVTDEEHGTLLSALQFPPYELPIEMWKARPARANAPRRLARTVHPDGGVWLVHSVYLEKDTMDRDRSYFSHLLRLSDAEPVAVLRSWGAAEWITDYPRGAEKVLSRGRLPVGSLVADAALANFLSDNEQTGPTEISVAVCPHRLRANSLARRDLVERFLHAYSLMRNENGDRDRLFVHAEPGLVAMLLYAAARLLPTAWTAELTFSTFEPYHRGIQGFKLTQVVGTFIGEAGNGLDRDLVSLRGYGLDALFPDRSSRELGGALPAGIAELVELARASEWSLLADVHKLIGSEKDALSRVTKSIALARGLGRLNRGKPTIDDLLALRADSRGADALARAADAVWPHLRAAALTDSRVRIAYKDWLAQPERLDEFRRESAKALVKGDLAGWDSRWAIVREVAEAPRKKHQVEKLLKNLDEHLLSMPFHARARLRAACVESGVWPDHHLLAPTNEEEFEALLAPDSPPEWQGYACFAVIGPDEKNWLLPSTAPFRKPMRERARKFLFTAPIAALAAYARAVRPYLETDPIFLRGLFLPHSASCRTLMDRLLRAKALKPGDWIKLIQVVNLYDGEWDGFLLEKDRLSRLLVALGGDGVGREVWKGYLDELSPALLSPLLAAPGADAKVVHNWERTVHAQLRLAADELTASGAKLVAALPPGGVGKLFAATDLLKWVEDPGLAEKLADTGEPAVACQAFGLAPLELLRAAYLKGGYSRLELPRDATAFAPFIALFRACYSLTPDFRRVSAAVTHWLALSASCPEQTRAAFQAHLVLALVQRDWHRDILEEPRQVSFLPTADARIREGLAVPSRKPPTPPVVDGGDEFAIEPTRRGSRTRAGARRRRRDSGSGIWIGAFVVIVLVVAAIGAILLVKALNKPRQTVPTDLENSPAKIEKGKK